MISVIIPTYNRGEYLKKALQSLQRQSFKDFEIIVADDGSSDDTGKIVKEFDARYFKEDHQGVSHARNLGAKNSCGEILAFFDDDALADRDWLENISKIMVREDIITGRAEPLKKNIWQYFAPHYYQGETPRESQILLEGNCAMRKKVFQDLNGFDENLDYGHEGEEFLSRAEKYRIMYYPNVIIFHDYAFGLINYFQKQFKFGEKAAYLKKQKKHIQNTDMVFPAKKKPSFWENAVIRIIGRLGSCFHFCGRIYGNFKYKKTA